MTKTNMAAPMNDEIDVDRFKDVYKKYKRRDRRLDVTDVVNLSKEGYLDSRVCKYELSKPSLTQFPGMKPFSEWKAYMLKEKEGFIVIRNPFERKYQRYWIQRCLMDFPTKPNKTNLDAHMERPSHVWQACCTDNKPDLQKTSFLMKLRWATLGYQYEWNTKEYFSDRVQMFPDDLSLLCAYIAETLGFSRYSSEAGIVNFYRMDSTLMGHTDVSELDKAAPLISFSFAQSCIFLIGGPTKATEPTPVFLHSGDICLMTGQARLSYHAVPRILEGDSENLLHSFYGEGECRQSDKLSGHVQISNEARDSDKTENGKSNTDNKHHSSIDAFKVDNEEEVDPYSGSANDKPSFMEVNQSNGAIQQYKDEPVIITPTCKGDKCTLNELQDHMDSVISKLPWEPFQDYLNVSRINVNVRQVLKEGLELGKCPAVIKPCDKSCEKT